MTIENGVSAKSPEEILFVDSESQSAPNELDRTHEIALAAYYKAEARGYEPGHELQDWLEAEADVLK
jgi:hypothetical protein